MGNKKRQAQFIAPLQPSAFAAFRPWRIGQELVVKDLPFGGKSKMLSTKKRRFFLKTKTTLELDRVFLTKM